MAEDTPARTVWGDAQTIKYLSEKLTESHQFHGALIRERDSWQVKYGVLRQIALQVVTTWDVAGPGFMDELNEEVQRFKEVLNLPGARASSPLDTLAQD